MEAAGHRVCGLKDCTGWGATGLHAIRCTRMYSFSRMRTPIVSSSCIWGVSRMQLRLASVYRRWERESTFRSWLQTTRI
jgi:hypothetical protein